MTESATLVYFVDDIQACSLEDLTPVDGIEVIQQYVDDKGCDRVIVAGPTAEAVIEYVRQEWGDEDPDWFADYIVARVECGEV